MIMIQVCIGSACHIKGSYNIINKLQELIKQKGLENQVGIKAAFCLGQCTKAVSVKVNDGEIQSLEEGKVEAFLTSLLAGRNA